MDFSFLSKMGFSMDDIGKIGEIIMSGGDENKIADELNAKFGMDKAQAKDIIKQSMDACKKYNLGDNLIAGANIAGFERVANAMMFQGIC